MLVALLVPLALAVLAYGIVLARAAIARRALPTVESTILGAIVSFFDTLGIGSFAPTAAWLKFRKLVPDRIIPPTMLVGLTPPSMIESAIFLILLGVFVDPVLLVGCVIALLAGGLVGAPLVAKATLWVVQMVVGIALLLAAIAYTMSNLDLFPVGGTAYSLSPGLTIAAIAANFVFGILVNFGVGNFAPTLVMFALMGLDPKLAFPIMAGGASLTGAGASIRHIQIGQIDFRVVLGLALGGIPAVLAAAFIVKTMPIEILRWLVTIVVLYAAAVMIRASWIGRRDGKTTSATASVAL